MITPSRNPGGTRYAHKSNYPDGNWRMQRLSLLRPSYTGTERGYGCGSAVFALSSSLVPILLTLALAGSLSVQIAKQLGVWMPRFRLAVYLLFLLSALVGLFS